MRVLITIDFEIQVYQNRYPVALMLGSVYITLLELCLLSGFFLAGTIETFSGLVSNVCSLCASTCFLLCFLFVQDELEEESDDDMGISLFDD